VSDTAAAALSARLRGLSSSFAAAAQRDAQQFERLFAEPPTVVLGDGSRVSATAVGGRSNDSVSSDAGGGPGNDTSGGHDTPGLWLASATPARSHGGPVRGVAALDARLSGDVARMRMMSPAALARARFGSSDHDEAVAAAAIAASVTPAASSHIDLGAETWIGLSPVRVPEPVTSIAAAVPPAGGALAVKGGWRERAEASLRFDRERLAALDRADLVFD
jgi:hypothetical protein